MGTNQKLDWDTLIQLADQHGALTLPAQSTLHGTYSTGRRGKIITARRLQQATLGGGASGAEEATLGDGGPGFRGDPLCKRNTYDIRIVSLIVVGIHTWGEAPPLF